MYAESVKGKPCNQYPKESYCSYISIEHNILLLEGVRRVTT